MSKGFTLDVRGLAGVMKEVENIAKEVKIQASEELNRFGGEVVENAKQLVASNSSDEGNLLRSINLDYAKPNKLSVEINVTADYAAFIEFGTRKFAAAQIATMPADWKDFAAQFKGEGGGSYDDFVKRIFEWIKRKGIRLEPKQYEQGDSFTGAGGTMRTPKKKKKQTIEEGQQQLAYMITKKILEEGIKAKPFLYPSVIKYTPKLTERMQKLLNT